MTDADKLQYPMPREPMFQSIYKGGGRRFTQSRKAINTKATIEVALHSAFQSLYKKGVVSESATAQSPEFALQSI